MTTKSSHHQDQALPMRALPTLVSSRPWRSDLTSGLTLLWLLLWMMSCVLPAWITALRMAEVTVASKAWIVLLVVLPVMVAVISVLAAQKWPMCLPYVVLGLMPTSFLTVMLILPRLTTHTPYPALTQIGIAVVWVAYLMVAAQRRVVPPRTVASAPLQHTPLPKAQDDQATYPSWLLVGFGVSTFLLAVVAPLWSSTSAAASVFSAVMAGVVSVVFLGVVVAPMMQSARGQKPIRPWRIAVYLVLATLCQVVCWWALDGVSQ